MPHEINLKKLLKTILLEYSSFYQTEVFSSAKSALNVTNINDKLCIYLCLPMRPLWHCL